MSVAENFQFFSGSSSRARKRRFCSFFERCRKNLRITVPLRAMCRSKLQISSKRSSQMFFVTRMGGTLRRYLRSEEHTSELQSHLNLVCRLLLEKKKNIL